MECNYKLFFFALFYLGRGRCRAGSERESGGVSEGEGSSCPLLSLRLEGPEDGVGVVVNLYLSICSFLNCI